MYSSKLIYILNSLYNKQHTHAHMRKYLFSGPSSKYVFKRKILYIIYVRDKFINHKLMLIILGLYRNLQNQTLSVFEA